MVNAQKKYNLSTILFEYYTFRLCNRHNFNLKIIPVTKLVRIKKNIFLFLPLKLTGGQEIEFHEIKTAGQKILRSWDQSNMGFFMRSKFANNAF